MLPELLDCSEFVNSDEFAKHLSPFAPEAAFVTASRLMLRKVKYLFDRREDFCIETTLATRALLKMTKQAQQKGYFVTVLYFWLNDPSIAVERVAARVRAGGHDIPEETIRRRYRMGLYYLFHEYMQTCDKWILADNSTPPFEVVAEGSSKGLVIRNMEKYNVIRCMATEDIAQLPPVENVAEFISKEIAKAPLAHDGVPYQNDQQPNDPS